MNAIAFYDITNVNPHPEFDPLPCRNLRIPPDHCALNLHGAPQGFHSTDE
jgi:hypothetical protein